MAMFTQKYLNALAQFMREIKVENLGNLARYEMTLDFENRLMSFLEADNAKFSRDKWVKATAIISQP
jgi:hypothetical protein